MSNLADDVGAYLATQSIGVIGTTLFKGTLPEKIDNCVAIYETTSGLPDMYLPVKTPFFQVYVRNKDYATGHTKMDAVRSALHGKLAFTQGSTFFMSIFAVTEIDHLGRDDQGRDGFRIMFKATTRAA